LVPAAIRSRLPVVIPILVLLVFLFDVVTPLGFSVWLLYFVPLILCFWIDREYAIPVLCGVILLFISAGYLISSPGLHTQYVLVNRILFSGVVICVSVVLWMIQRRHARLERELLSRRDLDAGSAGADRKFERFAHILNAELVPALSSVRSSLQSIRAGKGSVSPEDLARSEETIARAEQEIRFTKRMETVGKSPPRWQDLNEILREKIPGIRKHGLSVVTGPGRLWLYADPLLPEVFDEFIDNTLKYGLVSTVIRVMWHADENNLVLTFEDDGVGIPFSQKNKIFHDGVGRGLVLAREILGVTGISISETGEPERGTRIALSVPEGKYRFA
jgi:signal transduction histidine kinase